MTTPLSIFHLSLHVSDLSEAREFYGAVLGCSEGRRTAQWVDFDFFGHQLSLHLGTPQTTTQTGQVDSVAVPMPHFGAVLALDVWQSIVARLRAANVEFVLEPQERYPDTTGTQHTLFVLDPSGNAIEFKSMRERDQLFQSAS